MTSKVRLFSVLYLIYKELINRYFMRTPRLDYQGFNYHADNFGLLTNEE